MVKAHSWFSAYKSAILVCLFATFSIVGLTIITGCSQESQDDQLPDERYRIEFTNGRVEVISIKSGSEKSRYQVEKNLRSAGQNFINKNNQHYINIPDSVLADTVKAYIDEIISTFKSFEAQSDNIKIYVSSQDEQAQLSQFTNHFDLVGYKKLLENTVSKEHSEYINFHLAQIAKLQGEYNKSLEYYQAALDLKTKLEYLQGKGIAQLYLGQFEHAEVSLKEAELMAGDDGHPLGYSSQLNNIGSTLLVNGKYSEAIGYFRRSLDLKAKKLGENNQKLATTYYSLSTAYRRAGELSNSIKSLNTFIKLIDPTNVQAKLIGYFQQGLNFQALQHYKKSIKAFNRSIELFVSSKINTPNFYSQALFKKAFSQIKINELKGALISLEEAKLSLKNTNSSENNLLSNRIEASLAQVNAQSGDMKQAIIHYKRVLDNTIVNSTASKELLMLSNGHLGSAYSVLADHKNAYISYVTSIEAANQYFGALDSRTAAVNSNLGIYLYSVKRFDEAIYFLEKALKIDIELYGSEHVVTKKRKSNLKVVKEAKTNNKT